MPKNSGADRGECWPGEPNDAVGQALWEAAWDCLIGESNEPSLEPLAEFLKAGYPLAGVLAAELVSAIEAKRMSIFPMEGLRHALAERYKIGAYCLVRIVRSRRAASDRIYAKASEKFGVSARSARRATDEFKAAWREAEGVGAYDPAAMSHFDILTIWAAAMREICAENGVEFYEEMVSRVIPDQTPPG